MTAVPIRDTQFVSWIDPDAWMESMTGKRWTDVLEDEALRWNSAIHEPAIRQRIAPFRAMLDAAQHSTNTSPPFISGDLQIQQLGSFDVSWSAFHSSKRHLSRDVLTQGSGVWSTQDVGDGAEDFELTYWSSPTATHSSWSKHPVGPTLGIHGSTLFYLGVRNKLQYYQLWSCSATTGKSARCLYTEQSPEANLSIERQPDGRLLLVREVSQDKTVYEIQPSGELRHVRQYWPIPSSWKHPDLSSYGIEFSWPRLGYLCTTQHGQRTLWYCTSSHSPKALITIPAGAITIDPWASWNGDTTVQVRVVQPDIGSTVYSLHNGTLRVKAPSQPRGYVTRRYKAISVDGTEVYGCITQKDSGQPTKLLVIGYGAYGLPTSVGSVYHRWAPLVQNGWAIVHTFLRGGGDHTLDWALAGQREGRQRTIADFSALLRVAQTITGISARYTAIYGRSAGGLLLGDMLRQYPDGSLFQCVYAEVPYVDELRTTTNPDLPLTALEYGEFGAPALRLEDLIHVVQTSPADSATTLVTPQIFVLTRTALHDSQVFAYESIKWIRRLRDNAPSGAPKLCCVEQDQGHFTPPDAAAAQWSVDLALLDGWMNPQAQQ